VGEIRVDIDLNFAIVIVIELKRFLVLIDPVPDFIIKLPGERS